LLLMLLTVYCIEFCKKVKENINKSQANAIISVPLF